MADTAPFGVAILDIHDGEWALWQVSTDRAKGPIRAIATNAVVSTGFDERAFRSLAGDRQVLLTARAKNKCTEPLVLEAVPFSPSDFLALCSTWVDMLEDLFQAENLRRAEFNSVKVQERKDARAAGRKPGEYKRLAPLTGVDWPLPPPSSLWESQIDCTEPVIGEALRIANGCGRLLNYWLDIELNRTNRNRNYFNGIGGEEIRSWPSPVGKTTND